MNDERFFDLVTKFLSNEITEKEKNELTIILQIEHYKKTFEAIVEKWNNQNRDGVKFSLDEGMENLTKKLSARDKSFYWGDKVKPNRNMLSNPYLLKIAASIVFILVVASAAIYFSGLFKQKTNEITWNEKTTVFGQKYILELGDHSVITLNADSKIKYPVAFGKDSREIYLEGEAYFNVSHDKTKPFIVHTGNISTTVLGTQFNVNAFPNEKKISVSLVEGEVKVSKEKNGTEEGIVVLKPKQQLQYNKENEISSFEEFDIQKEIGWKDNILKFSNESLGSVFKKLQRAYGVKFQLADKSYENIKITTKFNNSSLWTVSEVIKKLTGLNYRTIKENNETKKIIFYKK